MVRRMSRQMSSVRFFHRVIVHLIDTDDAFDARTYRRTSPWMSLARRRLLFEKHLELLSSVIEPVLVADHRVNIALRNGVLAITL